MHIIFRNAIICNGSCSFCTAKNVSDFVSGDNLLNIDKKLYELIQFDFDRLEDKIVRNPEFKNDKVNFSIWGGDPLASLSAYQELYDFLEYIGNKYNKGITLSGSTNGLAFSRKEVAEYILSKPNIRMQLSHDGLGQYMRTQTIDPLELDCMKDLWERGRLDHINCVLNQLNFSVKENIKYFERFPFTKRVRIYSARDEIYKYSTKCNGWINNNYYHYMDGVEYLNMCIHNDENYDVLKHACDVFFDEYYWLGEQIKEGKCKRYAQPYINRIKDVLKPYKYNKANCVRYHFGEIDYSNCIDTIGDYTECEILDGSSSVPNKEHKFPNKCNNCEFRDSHECNQCGRLLLSENKCEHNYRLNLWAKHFRHLTNNV